MASVIGICNIALAHIGSKLINALSDADPSATLCSLMYPDARDFVLQDYDWNFAEKRVVGALVSGADAVDYNYVYAYPANCLKVRKIYQTVTGKKPIDYKITAGDDVDTRWILTNEEAAVIVYTVQVSDPNVFSVGFRTALSWKLAADLAYPITKSLNIEKAKLAIYNGYISAAQLSSAREGSEEINIDDDFLVARS